MKIVSSNPTPLPTVSFDKEAQLRIRAHALMVISNLPLAEPDEARAIVAMLPRLLPMALATAIPPVIVDGGAS